VEGRDGVAIRRGGRLAWLAALLLAIAPLASCGEDANGAREQIETAVRDVQRAFAAGDTERVCRLLSRSARKQIRAMGHDPEGYPSAACYVDLYMFADGVTSKPRWRERTARAVRDIEIGDGRATATLEFEDGQTASLPLVEEGGTWKVDALYGGIPAGRQRDSY